MNINQPGIAPPVSLLRSLISFAVIIVLGCYLNAHAQWTSGTDITNTNSGNVGIGKSSPAHKLDVLSSSGTIARFDSTASANTQVLINGPSGFNAMLTLQRAGVAQWLIGNIGSNDRFIFANAGGNEMFTIQQNGNVGIGTASPSEKLVTVGNMLAGNITSHTQIYPSYDSQSNMIFELGYGTATSAITPLASLVLSKNLTSTSNAIGAINFANSSIANGNEKRLATISGWTDGATNSGAMVFTTSATGTLNERMRIGANGKVGVGTSLPTALFHIMTASSDYEALRLHRNANTNLFGVAQLFSLNNSSGATTDYAQISSAIVSNTAGAENGVLAFSTRGAGTLAERMRITDTGVVGIGTPTPGTNYRLNVQGGKINSSDGLCINDSCITNWATVASPWLGSGSIYFNTGNVGIGTSALPNRKLEVVGGNVFHQFSTASNSEYGVYTALNNNHFTSNLSFDGAWKMIGTGKGSLIATGPNNGGNAFAVYADNTSRSANAAATLAQLLVVTMDGKLGVGTPSPSELLHVEGNAKVTGTLEGGNIKAKYQDVAEWVESSQELSAGTVVVLDSSRSNQVIAATEAYDSRVAGVISLRPGIVLGEEGESRVLVATTGRVKVKVDATNGPIQIGDLLVTSNKTGVAMKSVPVEFAGVRMHRPGTLIGKALEPLAQGTGEILVLLSLQ